MNYALKYPYILLILLGSFFNSNKGWSQELSSKSALEKDFETAMEYLGSFKNDSANIIFSQIIAELEDAGELETGFGLKVQLHQAEVLEKDHQDEIAIQKLIQIVETSEQKNEQEVYARAQLSLARLYEKMGRSAQCLKHLELARKVISQHNLEDVYPRFAIRYSSYHRIYNHQDSSLFYAKEVVRTAPQFDQNDEEATGYLLMGLLLGDSLYHESIGYFKEAGAIYKRLEDFSGYSATLSNKSRLHLQNNQNQLALLYNDSSLIAAKTATEFGHDAPWMFYTKYHDRAVIFKTLEQHDSAWHYLNKAYQMEMTDMGNFNNDKVIAIDALFQDEKKAQKIEAQAMMISYEKARQKWMFGIVGLVIFFASILTYYYLRLRKANKKTLQQAMALTKVNEDLSISLEKQILLQGEVHHRVKNNLQIIISLLELQQNDIKDEAARKSFETMSNRIFSMAAIHEMLYQNKGTEMVNLLDYTKSLCKHFRSFVEESNSPIFQLEIDDNFFNIETLMPLGIILNELLTNSLKYAGNLEKKLKIRIKLEPVQDGFVMKYRDNGPGFPNGALVEREGGLGTYLLRSMSRQLDGHLISMNDDGAVYSIFFKEKIQN